MEDDFPLEKVMLGIDDLIRSVKIDEKIERLKKDLKENEVIVIKEERVSCWRRPLSVRVAKKGEKLLEKEYILEF